MSRSLAPQSCLLRTAALGLLGAFLALGVSAQTFQYPTNCKITSDGQLDNSATIATPLLVDQDFRSETLTDSYAISSATAFNVNDVKGSFAEVFRNSFGGGGCVSEISASIADQVSWSLVGDTSSMTVFIDSLSVESVSIDRQNITGAGVPITASSTYEVPQAQQLLLEIPFEVTGNTKRRLVVDPFAFSRTDTASTTGSSVGAYQVFADNNKNCTVDAGDSSNIGSKGIVGPNSTFSEPPTSYSITPGRYVLSIAYFTDVDLAAFSADCLSSPSSSGWHNDGFDLVLTLF
ncbi:MAG: hypothetical protein AAGC60_07150 [Acidobacteriota bacterium]